MASHCSWLKLALAGPGLTPAHPHGTWMLSPALHWACWLTHLLRQHFSLFHVFLLLENDWICVVHKRKVEGIWSYSIELDGKIYIFILHNHCRRKYYVLRKVLINIKRVKLTNKLFSKVLVRNIELNPWTYFLIPGFTAICHSWLRLFNEERFKFLMISSLKNFVHTSRW